jgi:predicted lipoprotein with Yx(FWY)xxD motif
MDAMYRSALALALPVLAVGVAACGSGGGSSGSAKTPASSSTSTAAATVKLQKTSLGGILTDGNGRTLYLFEKDKGPKSTCFGACAAAWPPLTTKATPMAGSGVSAAKLGTSPRSGGREVTYAGHPLYLYAGDTASGQINGQGLDQFGAEWYALSGSGRKVEEGGS